MKSKKWSVLFLISSIAVFSAGFYLKYLKSYSDEKFQTEAISLKGDVTQRQLKLGETIAFLNNLEELASSNKIENTHNKLALKKLKSIHLISVIMMLTSIAAILNISKRLFSYKRT